MRFPTPFGLQIFAVTRADVAFYNCGEEQLDKLMINDGILCHEHAKRKLEIYADKHGVKKVKRLCWLCVRIQTMQHGWKIM
jgi:hypothetical protein